MPSVSYSARRRHAAAWMRVFAGQEDDMLKKRAVIGGVITLAAAIPSASQAQALQNQEVPAATTKGCFSTSTSR
jgi:RES domain-containing protein